MIIRFISGDELHLETGTKREKLIQMMASEKSRGIKYMYIEKTIINLDQVEFIGEEDSDED